MLPIPYHLLVRYEPDLYFILIISYSNEIVMDRFEKKKTKK